MYLIYNIKTIALILQALIYNTKTSSLILQVQYIYNLNRAEGENIFYKDSWQLREAITITIVLNRRKNPIKDL